MTILNLICAILCLVQLNRWMNWTKIKNWITGDGTYFYLQNDWKLAREKAKAGWKVIWFDKVTKDRLLVLSYGYEYLIGTKGGVKCFMLHEYFPTKKGMKWCGEFWTKGGLICCSTYDIMDWAGYIHNPQLEKPCSYSQ